MKIKFEENSVFVRIPWQLILLVVMTHCLLGYFWNSRLFNDLPVLFWDSAAYDYENLLFNNVVNRLGILKGFDFFTELSSIGRPLLSHLVFLFFGKGVSSLFIVNGIFLFFLYVAVSMISEHISKGSSRLSVLILSLTPSLYLYGARIEQTHFSSFSSIFLACSLIYITSPMEKFNLKLFLAACLIAFAILIKPAQAALLIPFWAGTIFYRIRMQIKNTRINSSPFVDIALFSIIILIISGPFLITRFLKLYSYYTLNLKIENHMMVNGSKWFFWYFENYLTEHLGILTAILCLFFILTAMAKRQISSIVLPRISIVWLMILPVVSFFETRAGAISIASIVFVPIFLGVNINKFIELKIISNTRKKIIVIFLFIFFAQCLIWSHQSYRKEIDYKDWHVTELITAIEEDAQQYPRQSSIITAVSLHEIFNTAAISGLLMRRGNNIFYNNNQLEISMKPIENIWEIINLSNYVITKSSDTSPVYLKKREILHNQIYEEIMERDQYHELWVSPLLPDGSIVRLYFNGERDCLVNGLTVDKWISDSASFTCHGSYSDFLNLEITASNLNNESTKVISAEIIDLVSNKKIMDLTWDKPNRTTKQVSIPIKKAVNPIFRIKVIKGVKFKNDNRELFLHDIKIKSV